MQLVWSTQFLLIKTFRSESSTLEVRNSISKGPLACRWLCEADNVLLFMKLWTRQRSILRVASTLSRQDIKMFGKSLMLCFICPRHVPT